LPGKRVRARTKRTRLRAHPPCRHAHREGGGGDAAAAARRRPAGRRRRATRLLGRLGARRPRAAPGGAQPVLQARAWPQRARDRPAVAMLGVVSAMMDFAHNFLKGSKHLARAWPGMTAGAEQGQAAPRRRADRSYLVTGGLGGLGLALAAWLARRGARRLLLTSRRGARTGAQAAALAALRGVGVQVGPQADRGCSPQLAAADLGPTEAALCGDLGDALLPLMCVLCYVFRGRLCWPRMLGVLRNMGSVTRHVQTSQARALLLAPSPGGCIPGAADARRRSAPKSYCCERLRAGGRQPGGREHRGGRARGRGRGGRAGAARGRAAPGHAAARRAARFAGALTITLPVAFRARRARRRGRPDVLGSWARCRGTGDASWRHACGRVVRWSRCRGPGRARCGRAQTGAGWNAAAAPKAWAMQHLDAACRSLPELDHFVLFSSIVAAHGQPGGPAWLRCTGHRCTACVTHRVALADNPAESVLAQQMLAIRSDAVYALTLTLS